MNDSNTYKYYISNNRPLHSYFYVVRENTKVQDICFRYFFTSEDRITQENDCWIKSDYVSMHEYFPRLYDRISEEEVLLLML